MQNERRRTFKIQVGSPRTVAKCRANSCIFCIQKLYFLSRMRVHLAHCFPRRLRTNHRARLFLGQKPSRKHPGGRRYQWRPRNRLSRHITPGVQNTFVFKIMRAAQPIISQRFWRFLGWPLTIATFSRKRLGNLLHEHGSTAKQDHKKIFTKFRHPDAKPDSQVTHASTHNKNTTTLNHVRINSSSCKCFIMLCDLHVSVLSVFCFLTTPAHTYTSGHQTDQATSTGHQVY